MEPRKRGPEGPEKGSGGPKVGFGGSHKKRPSRTRIPLLPSREDGFFRGKGTFFTFSLRKPLLRAWEDGFFRVLDPPPPEAEKKNPPLFGGAGDKMEPVALTCAP